MIAQEYAFHRPRKRSEVLELLAKHGSEARVLAGGMSLVPMMTLGLAQPEVVVSLNRVEGLDGVEEGDAVLKIGAMTRHATLAAHPLVARHAPVLASAALSIGDVQIRNRGTVGGSFAHADPAADYLPAALVLGARVHLASQDRERSVPAAEFFQGLMSTSIESGEMITEIEVPKLDPGAGSAYQRLHRVEGNFAIVAAAAVVEETRALVALGGVGPAPIQLDLSRFLRRGRPDLDGVAQAAYEASGDAIGDLNGSADYRRAMARVYATRVVESAAAAR